MCNKANLFLQIVLVLFLTFSSLKLGDGFPNNPLLTLQKVYREGRTDSKYLSIYFFLFNIAQKMKFSIKDFFSKCD